MSDSQIDNGTGCTNQSRCDLNMCPSQGNKSVEGQVHAMRNREAGSARWFRVAFVASINKQQIDNHRENGDGKSKVGHLLDAVVIEHADSPILALDI